MRDQFHQDADGSNPLRMWTHAETSKAVPYLRSVVGSLREHWLEWQRLELQVRRLDTAPGRADRQALIARAEAARDAGLAEDRFNDALSELEAIDVHSLDPVQGLALIPFRKGENLAWFIFGLFVPQGLDGWRYHKDPPETRRVLADQPDRAAADRVFASMQWL